MHAKVRAQEEITLAEDKANARPMNIIVVLEKTHAKVKEVAARTPD
jgi:hypothetical protein